MISSMNVLKWFCREDVPRYDEENRYCEMASGEERPYSWKDTEVVLLLITKDILEDLLGVEGVMCP